MITRHGSTKFTGTHPNMVPDGLGDLMYEQDRIRDFAFLHDGIGVAASDLYRKDLTGAQRPSEGGIVTDHVSSETVDISAGFGYVKKAVALGTTAAVPPLTADEDMMVRVAWPALTAQGTFSGTTTYYVKMAANDANGLSRSRVKAGGTWYFSVDASYLLTISTASPTTYEILLATISVTSGNIGRINQSAYDTPGGYYDLIVDSVAKLEAWGRATLGQFVRVYVKTGTWTATVLGTTAAIVDLGTAGTREIKAEIGATLVYSGSSAGVIYGLYRGTLPADGFEKCTRISITITNTGAGVAMGCNKLNGLENVICTVNGGGGSYGFNECYNLTKCTATSSLSVAGSLLAVGFYGGNNLNECNGTVDAGSTNNQAVAFHTCNFLIHCNGTMSGVNGSGFHTCTYLTSCTGIAHAGVLACGFHSCSHIHSCVGTASGDGTTVGFQDCTYIYDSQGRGYDGTGGYGIQTATVVIGCVGSGTGSSVGYGFANCKKMQQNSQGTCTTAGYTGCYADKGTTDAVADTAAGGHNS